MRTTIPSKRVATAALLFAMVAAGSFSAAAQEYCVACTGPDAVYRCVVEQAAPTGMTLKLLCIGTLAREGRHGSCAVKGGTVFDCNGPVRRIDARTAAQNLVKAPVAPGPAGSTSAPGAPTGPQPGVPAPPVDAPGQALPGSLPGAPPPREPKKAGAPPQTVEQVAKDMSRTSGETLGKAGNAIAGGTAKAWGCIASLFQSC